MSTEEKLDQLLAGIGQLTKVIEESKASDGGRVAAAEDGRTELAQKATAVARERTDAEIAKEKADRKAEIDEAVKAALLNTRTPSLLAAIGQGSGAPTEGRMIRQAALPPHDALKAIFTDYQAGELLGGLVDVMWGMKAADFAMVNQGKAKLSELTEWAGVPEASKATLGATGATGGYVLPNNLVDTLIKPNVQEALYQNLVTVRSGVNVRGVDIPYRTGAPARMTFQDWGTTKENVDEAYGSYTALLGTIARIYDIGKQYARFSSGAAERDVMDELGKAAILGENFYVLAGAGTGSLGSGDPTTGVYTALTAAGMGGAFTTTGAPAAGTVAGSAAAQFATAFGAMATRSRRPTAVVTDAVTFWSLYSQGSDNAGFWMSDLLGAGFTIGADTALRWRGVPILYDANFDTNTGTTKRAIAADWPEFKLYRGMEFRVDTSDVAGERWDKNLIGFRGEEEIGFNAKSAIFTGAAQLITGVIP
jgi:HK97 family phage major capsid protein